MRRRFFLRTIICSFKNSGAMHLLKLVLVGLVCVAGLFFMSKSTTRSVQRNNYYELLGVSRKAGNKDVKRAYRRLAAKYHPDKNPHDPEANDKFVYLAKVHEVLTDPEKRAIYDRFGEAGLEGNSHPQPEPKHFKRGHFAKKPRQEDFRFKDFFHSAHHHDNQGFRFVFDDEDLVADQQRQRRAPNNEGRRCRTTTRKVGNMVWTQTQCN